MRIVHLGGNYIVFGSFQSPCFFSSLLAITVTITPILYQWKHFPVRVFSISATRASNYLTIIMYILFP